MGEEEKKNMDLANELGDLIQSVKKDADDTAPTSKQVEYRMTLPSASVTGAAAPGGEAEVRDYVTKHRRIPPQKIRQTGWVVMAIAFGTSLGNLFVDPLVFFPPVFVIEVILVPLPFYITGLVLLGVANHREQS